MTNVTTLLCCGWSKDSPVETPLVTPLHWSQLEIFLMKYYHNLATFDPINNGHNKADYLLFSIPWTPRTPMGSGSNNYIFNPIVVSLLNVQLQWTSMIITIWSDLIHNTSKHKVRQMKMLVKILNQESTEWKVPTYCHSGPRALIKSLLYMTCFNVLLI